MAALLDSHPISQRQEPCLGKVMKQAGAELGQAQLQTGIGL